MSLSDEIARKIQMLEANVADLRALHAQMLMQQASAKVLAGPWSLDSQTCEECPDLSCAGCPRRPAA